jgi:glycosyltransferase involved in cell wall biosynthesis
MRVLLVNDYGTPTGGAELGMLTLREGLRARGHEVRLFASRAQPVPGVESRADDECFGTTSRLRTLVQTANPLAARSLRRVLAEFRPDVVHVKLFLTQLSPLILRELEGVPSLFHAVWYRVVCPVGTKRLPGGEACTHRAGAACLREGCLPLRDWLPLMWQMREWRRRRGVFRLVVANSEATKRHLTEAGIGPVEVVWNGVPACAPRAALAGPPVVVFAGRLVREKGADVLLRAFAAVAAREKDARLLLFGEGPERERLSRLADELGVAARVSMPGHVGRAEMERRCAGAWVQVVPSLWEEPFGIVAAEASMRGTAVVASASGGLAEIVRDGETGLLVPPGDADALADALARLLGDRDLAERMGCAGREFALRHFNEDAYADNFIRLYERIVDSRQ